MKLIVGLGNPAKTYAHNRHNVGFRCINYLAKLHSISMKQRQCQAQTGNGEIAGVKVLLAKPTTFVNLSGEAVGRLVHVYKIPLEDVIIICDDLDLPPGKLRLRADGSAGGHKGLNSVITALGSQEFARVKIGIGRPNKEDGTPVTDEEAVVNYVLSDFTRREEAIIKPAIVRAAEAVESILSDGIAAAMNKFN
jgi:PTH1 family peptidyl-tRNA hydrolase